MRNYRIVSRFALLVLAIGIVCMSGLIGAPASAAHSYNVLHSFAGEPADGAYPQVGSLFLSGTNLYGMTFEGGANGQGAIFKFSTKTKQLTLLHSFDGAADGATPYGSLILSGTNLYGMASVGGANGNGVIFSLK